MYKSLNFVKVIIMVLYFEINFHLVAFRKWITSRQQPGQIVPVLVMNTSWYWN